MLTGDIIDDRFELLACTGSGGMGTVYRARDLTTQDLVAIKVLHEDSEGTTARFTKEANVLATLEHAHIVRYIAHGIASTGELYLAMEWLEGEELETRMRRERLGVAECVELGLRVARALGVAHALGVVHRDIKPNNIYLVGSSVEKAKILDFGLARMRGKTILTQTGSVIGTPGYMSPEQARGDREGVDARADVFSLGCVLYECVTGQAAFVGAHVMAVLAKVLLEEAPRARKLRPDLPKEFDNLLARMMSKKMALRPTNGMEVAEALERIAFQLRNTTNIEGPASLRMTSDESRLVSLVAVLPTVGMSPGDTEPLTEKSQRILDIVRSTLEACKATVEPLAGDGVVVMFDGLAHAGDVVAVAARSALRLKELLPLEIVALFTGRSAGGNPLVVGELIDRTAGFAQSITPKSFPRRFASGIVIDDVSRLLVGGRFVVTEGAGHWILEGEPPRDYLKRSVLGHRIPCVGRERDMRSMFEYIREGFDQPSARAILLVGPAGVGKSRLRLEMVDQLSAEIPGLVTISGRGDWLGVGSTSGLLRGALRTALQLDTAESEALERERLSEIVGVCGPVDAPRVAMCVGEMLGVDFPEVSWSQWERARRDPAFMAESIQEAFIDFVRARAEIGPLLWILEDLHWGDAASVRLIDAVLRDLPEAPIVVLAVARPEVYEVFPGLWQDRHLQTVRLGRLSKKASEAMTTAILGENIDRGTIETIVERADGNAFFIEELSRAIVERRAEQLPDTIAGMVETRIMTLPPVQRLALRAASIFGRKFRMNGAAALIQASLGDVSAVAVYEDLIDREFFERRAGAKQMGHDELAFRQALIQQTAYAMLTPRDRVVGHKLAAVWLEGEGELDRVILAEHYGRGGEPARAIGHYLAAAKQALQGGDGIVALDLVKRALACGAEGETENACLAIQTEVLRLAGAEVVLQHAEGLFAAGRAEEAKVSLRRLVTDLLDEARELTDSRARQQFWDNVPVRARMFDLAKLWGVKRT